MRRLTFFLIFLICINLSFSVNFPGLQLWLDASNSSTVILNGNNVTQWNDISGNGNNASQLTSSDQPLYDLNSINNKNSLQFDGINDHVDLNSVLPNSGDFTLFFAIKIFSNITKTSSQEIFVARDEATTPRGSIDLGVQNPVALDGTMTVYNINTSLRGSYIKDNVVEGVRVVAIKLSGGTTTISIDGSPKTVFNTTAGGLDGFSNINRIGANVDVAPLPFTGNIGEMIYYNESLSTANETFVINYLQNKWVETFDVTPPGQVTDLSMDSSDFDSITWSWNNPLDVDFNSSLIYIDDAFETITTNTTFTLENLPQGESFIITIYTQDHEGNINNSGVNSTGFTLGFPEIDVSNVTIRGTIQSENPQLEEVQRHQRENIVFIFFIIFLFFVTAFFFWKHLQLKNEAKENKELGNWGFNFFCLLVIFFNIFVTLPAVFVGYVIGNGVILLITSYFSVLTFFLICYIIFRSWTPINRFAKDPKRGILRFESYLRGRFKNV